MIWSPNCQPNARVAQQQQSKTATTMPMIRPVFFFFGASGETGISFMISSPGKKMFAQINLHTIQCANYIRQFVSCLYDATTTKVLVKK